MANGYFIIALILAQALVLFNGQTNAQSLTDSMSVSASTSASLSTSNSASASTSNSMSTSGSPSTSVSTSASVSQSTSTSATSTTPSPTSTGTTSTTASSTSTNTTSTTPSSTSTGTTSTTASSTSTNTTSTTPSSTSTNTTSTTPSSTSTGTTSTTPSNTSTSATPSVSASNSTSTTTSTSSINSNNTSTSTPSTTTSPSPTTSSVTSGVSSSVAPSSPGSVVIICVHVKVSACDASFLQSQSQSLFTNFSTNVRNTFKNQATEYVLSIDPQSSACGPISYFVICAKVTFKLGIIPTGKTIKAILQEEIADGVLINLPVSNTQYNVTFQGVTITDVVRDGQCKQVCCGASGPLGFEQQCTPRIHKCEGFLGEQTEQTGHCHGRDGDACKGVQCDSDDSGVSSHLPNFSLLMLLTVASFLKSTV